MRRPSLIIAVSAVACISHSTSYDPHNDDVAMTAITQAWSGNGATLSLCEDPTATAAAAVMVSAGNTCQTQNVVRGGGLGTTHAETTGAGCGGCPIGNDAFVTGTVSGGPLAAATAVTGKIYLGSGYDDDPYAFPYTLDLTCVDPTSPCTVGGTIEADGSVHLTITLGGPAAIGNPAFDAQLVTTGAASCPG